MSALDQARSYINLGVNEVVRAAQEFIDNPPVVVSQNTIDAVHYALAALQSAKTDLDAATDSKDWAVIASEVLAGIAHLVPLVAPQIGPFLYFLPSIISVAQAVISGVAPAAKHPKTPSPEMIAAAATVVPTDQPVTTDEPAVDEATTKASARKSAKKAADEASSPDVATA